MIEESPRLTRSQQAEITRSAIITAAMRQFSVHGLDGASTAEIMKAANVNKALLYYYFKSKEGLYEAAFQEVFGEDVKNWLAELGSSRTPGEHLIRAAVNHFDRFYNRREAQMFLQQELLRTWSTGKQAPYVVDSAIRPWANKLKATIREGIRSGELRKVDTQQAVVAICGANVFFFINAPVISYVLECDTLSPESIKAQRKTVAEFVGCLFFSDSAHGLKIAKRVLTQMPAPQYREMQRVS
jgi:TetR/AcrR family transcriptional regulator